MKIEYEVNHQTCKRKDKNLIVNDSQNYLEIEFTFNEDWDGCDKFVFFRCHNINYPYGMTNNKIIVPAIFLKDGWLRFGVYGINDEMVITTNLSHVRLGKSYYDSETGEIDDTIYTHSVVEEIFIEINGKSDVGHTHSEYVVKEEGKGLFSGSYTDLTDKPLIPSKVSDLINDSVFIETSTTPGLIKNDGTIDTNTYSQTGHTHLMEDITDLRLPAAVKVVTDKGTASADTMDKLYIEVKNDSVDVYYTTKSGDVYSWHKLDDDIFDDLSIDWDNIENKPTDVSDFTDNYNTAFTPKAHNHVVNDITDLDIPSDISDLTDSTGVIPSDVSDLTDVHDTAFTPKSHNHVMADVTDLDIPTDVSELTDTQNTPFTPKAHTHSKEDITDLGDYIEKSSTNGLVKNDGTIDTTQYVSDVSGKADVADFDTIEATITYTDTTTETVEFYIVPRT